MKLEIVEVSGEGCANCLSLLPVLTRLAQEKGIAFRHLPLGEQTREEIERLHIQRVPTVLLLCDGAPVASCTGYQPEEILDVWLDAKIREAERLKTAK